MNLLHQLIDGFRDKRIDQVGFTIFSKLCGIKILGAVKVLKGDGLGSDVGIISLGVTTIGLGEFLGFTTRDKADLHGLANSCGCEVSGESREDAKLATKASKHLLGKDSRGGCNCVRHRYLGIRDWENYLVAVRMA